MKTILLEPNNAGSQISMNQRWKQSGSTLPFKDWLEREKQKDFYLNANGIAEGEPPPIFRPGKAFSDSMSKTLDSLHNTLPEKNAVSRGTLFGIPSYVFWVAGGLVAAAIVYKIATKNK